MNILASKMGALQGVAEHEMGDFLGNGSNCCGQIGVSYGDCLPE
jgi:hypothetical protein